MTVGAEKLLHFRLQLILLRLEEVLNDGVHQLIQLLLQLCHVTVEGAEELILVELLNQQRDDSSG